MSERTAAVPKLTETNWVTWSIQQAAHMCQLSVWSVITEEHTAPALELLEASTNEDRATIPLTTEQKALNIRIRLNNNATAECFCSAREKAAGNIFVHLSQSQCAHVWYLVSFMYLSSRTIYLLFFISHCTISSTS
jgi:hypothetical protein